MMPQQPIQSAPDKMQPRIGVGQIRDAIRNKKTEREGILKPNNQGNNDQNRPEQMKRETSNRYSEAARLTCEIIELYETVFEEQGRQTSIEVLKLRHVFLDELKCQIDFSSRCENYEQALDAARKAVVHTYQNRCAMVPVDAAIDAIAQIMLLRALGRQYHEFRNRTLELKKSSAGIYEANILSRTKECILLATEYLKYARALKKLNMHYPARRCRELAATEYFNAARVALFGSDKQLASETARRHLETCFLLSTSEGQESEPDAKDPAIVAEIERQLNFLIRQIDPVK